ncbi:sugar transferase [Marinilabiliaceae bacterium JC017]|nr:sugar transferase [Marinilabiliaceae bacterium JC017]
MDSTGSATTFDLTNAHQQTVGTIDFSQPVKLSTVEQKESILRELDISIYDYLTQHLIPERQSVKVLVTNSIEDLRKESFKDIRSFVNLQRINDVRWLNNYFATVNIKLPDAGLFIGCIETVLTRKEKLYKNGKNIFKFLYWVYCFIFHRVFPKTKYLQRIYYFITRGKYRWLTKAETLGRLVSCGFEVIEYKDLNGLLFFVVMKTRAPHNDKQASTGAVFPMRRIGKGGKIIKVYKFRTMHPYSEYLQDFVIKLNGYNEVGKPANDFRLTRWGKFFRKYWLDEIPQVLNVLKGELNIVGVRPLSLTRFKELPSDIQKERVRYKPGCIPPYVALLMPDASGNIEAERIYLREKRMHPVKTDIKFFLLSVYNILTGKIRSS